MGDRLGLSVPDSLLRAHAPPTEGRSGASPVPPERGTSAVPALGPLLRGMAPDLGLLTAIAAAGAVVDGALVVFAPHLRRALHVSDHGVAGLVALVAVTRRVAGVGVAPLCRRIGRWPVVAAGSAVVGVLTPVLGLTRSLGAAVLVLVLVAVAGAPTPTAHLALLGDGSPPAGRARAFAVHLGGALAARGAGAALLAGAAALVGWRWALLVGLVGVPLAVLAARHREGGPDLLGWSGVVPRLSRLRSRGLLTAALAVIGFAAVGLPLTISAVLTHHHVRTGERGVMVVAASMMALAGLPLAGRLGDRWAAGDPSRLPLVAAGGLASFGVAAAGTAVMPGRAPMAVAMGVALAGLVVAMVAVAVIIAEVVPPAARTAAYGLAGGLAAFWGLTGAVVASAASAAWGPAGPLALLGAAGLGVAGVLVSARAEVAEDLASVALEVEERAGKADEGRSGRAPAALEVTRVGFSYGTQPVLFDVSVRVEAGEVVALLGTNGAGKSTLLRLVAGLDHPARGTIRLFGQDSTFAEAEHVLDLGVALLAGGRMTFPGLTVAENIRVGAQARFHDGAGWRRAEEEVFTTFPSLAARRQHRAGTLSGGEQQMLALGRVLLLRPRLLLLDELTLGLAPQVVEDLLAIVRRLNGEGATVVLVEQSANLALSLAGRALFMERGEVRFDGPSSELLARDELLRPVFLGGAADRVRARGR